MSPRISITEARGVCHSRSALFRNCIAEDPCHSRFVLLKIYAAQHLRCSRSRALMILVAQDLCCSRSVLLRLKNALFGSYVAQHPYCLAPGSVLLSVKICATQDLCCLGFVLLKMCVAQELVSRKLRTRVA